MILNKSQAKAVYAAMCELNNVGGRIKAEIPTTTGGTVSVQESYDDVVHIMFAIGGAVRTTESHTNQHAFGIAYSLIL